MKVTVSFKNKSKTVVVNNLKKISYSKIELFDDPLNEPQHVELTENFDELNLDDVKNEVKFIGDSTLSVISSSIESLLFEND